MKNYFIFFALIHFSGVCLSQENIASLDISNNKNFSGFDLLDLKDKKVFIIAEDVHNRVSTPDATLKFFMYLNENAGIRTLAIEGGASTAYLINLYLDTQDTVLLREIVRHTFFWSQEHHTFIRNLAEWNATLPPHKRIQVESADIEIKQESVILAMNYLMEGKDISKSRYLEGFRNIFKQRESHRQQYQALNTLYYYDKEQCQKLVDDVTGEMGDPLYHDLFGENYKLVTRMMKDLNVLYVFDYKRELKFKYRDEMIYTKLWWLSGRHPEGFLYVVGAKHTQPGASSGRLNEDEHSPFRHQVTYIMTTGKKKSGKYQGARSVTRISQKNPPMFNSNQAVLIKHPQNKSHGIHYTLAFSTNRHVNPFPKSFRD